MKWFDYAAPSSLGDAVAILAAAPDACLLAGGTDLLTQIRIGRKRTGLVVDVKRIAQLNEMRFDSGGGLTLGAAVPCYQIYGNQAVVRAFPSLAELASIIGGTQIQGRASIGGNLCNASPSADSVPLLIALAGVCNVLGPGGAREIAVEDFCVGPGRNALHPAELLVSLYIPPPQPRSGAHYLRFIPRNEMDIAVVGAGVSVSLENGHFRSARIALAAVGPTPLFLRAAGDALAGKPVNDASLADAAGIASAAAAPISDMRGNAGYRRHLCGVLTRRALEAAIAKARETQ